MRRIQEAARRVEALFYAIGQGIQATAKVVGALVVIATAVVLTMHFLHVEVYSAIPDVWPIYQPTGLPNVPSLP